MDGANHGTHGRFAAQAAGPFRRGAGDARTYASLEACARAIAARIADPRERLQPLCDALWDALHGRGISWIGFYLEDDEATAASAGADARMLLAARRDKPACSPIGVHGACGQAFLEDAVRLIEDVSLLGSGYIACDPRDQSELVIPVYRNSERWGVLDADSHEFACFGAEDVEGLSAVLRAAGLLDRNLPVRADRLRSSSGSL